MSAACQIVLYNQVLATTVAIANDTGFGGSKCKYIVEQTSPSELISVNIFAADISKYKGNWKRKLINLLEKRCSL